MKSEIYWITRLDSFQTVFLIMVVLCLLATIATLLWCEASKSNDEYSFNSGKIEERAKVRKMYRGKVKYYSIGTIVFFILWALTPTKDDAILIIGGDAAYQYISKDTSLQKLPYKTTELLKEILDKKIEEVKNSDKK